jgi:hypothetical protein
MFTGPLLFCILETEFDSLVFHQLTTEFLSLQQGRKHIAALFCPTA